ncbi:MAG: hypothetical protein VR68_09295 [Peptococcaceae bacterium BRH_c4a]|nr:MAG: hypothetical protein VR68_09295 [Peptococcaceae bacterium BRH_c4a]
MNKIGIMQGRLSPPVNGKIQAFPWENWEQEFFTAQRCGFDFIDWIVEEYRFNENPLITEKGLRKINDLVKKTGVNIASVCADYFMDCPIIRCSPVELSERLNVLELLIGRLKEAGIQYLEIPFVDNSEIKDQDEIDGLVEIFKPLLDKIHRSGITLAFETSLPPETFLYFLQKLDHPSARANYDMGNSASLGYEPEKELSCYGKYIATVHVKDRLLGGGTVPVGGGSTDFDKCFSMLAKSGYTGPYILQVARGSDELLWSTKNKAFVVEQLQRWG